MERITTRKSIYASLAIAGLLLYYMMYIISTDTDSLFAIFARVSMFTAPIYFNDLYNKYSRYISIKDNIAEITERSGFGKFETKSFDMNQVLNIRSIPYGHVLTLNEDTIRLDHGYKDINIVINLIRSRLANPIE